MSSKRKSWLEETPSGGAKKMVKTPAKGFSKPTLKRVLIIVHSFCLSLVVTSSLISLSSEKSCAPTFFMGLLCSLAKIK